MFLQMFYSLQALKISCLQRIFFIGNHVVVDVFLMRIATFIAILPLKLT
jgi:hypothetical protein